MADHIQNQNLFAAFNWSSVSSEIGQRIQKIILGTSGMNQLIKVSEDTWSKWIEIP